jgi:hypothetical protein
MEHSIHLTEIESEPSHIHIARPRTAPPGATPVLGVEALVSDAMRCHGDPVELTGDARHRPETL